MLGREPTYLIERNGCVVLDDNTSNGSSSIVTSIERSVRGIHGDDKEGTETSKDWEVTATQIRFS